MQADAPVQLTQVPVKPTCNPNSIFDSGTCRDSLNAYNQAIQLRQQEEIQLYVKRQKEAAASQATAPLQAEIKTLQDQMRSNSVAAYQAQDAAHTAGVEQGTAIGVGVSLLLVCIFITVRRRIGSQQPKAQAASA